MNEHSFIKAVHRYLPSDLVRWKINDAYNGGIPDTYYLGPARSIFIEYKFIKLPKRSTTLIKCNLSENQRKWLHDLNINNQLAVVVIGCSEGGVVLINEQWTQDIANDLFQSAIISKKLIAEGITRVCREKTFDLSTVAL